jgi:hypothetical protein
MPSPVFSVLFGIGMLFSCMPPDQRGGAGERTPAVLTPLQAADSHRLLILDIGRWPNGREGSDHHQLRVIEVESGKTLAQAGIGFNTHLTLSTGGDEVAVISYFSGGGQRGASLLEFYRTRDLQRLQSGTLPDSVRLMGYQLGAAQDCQLSPKGTEILLEGPAGGGGAAHLASTALTCVKREVDVLGAYKISDKKVILPRCYGITFLKAADWPKLHIWNANLGLLEVVDFSTGKTVSRLYLGNDPAAAHMNPVDLEKADTPLIFRIRSRAQVVSDGRRYAYYVPRHPSNPKEPIDVLKKIDLAADPPKVIAKGEQPQPNLIGPVLISEAAGALFVVKAKVGPPGLNGSMVEPTRGIFVFDTKILKLKKEIEFPCDFTSLSISRDGKYLYGLDSEGRKLTVMDVSTSKEVKVLDNIGTYPHLMLALPDK